MRRGSWHFLINLTFRINLNLSWMHYYQIYFGLVLVGYFSVLNVYKSCWYVFFHLLTAGMRIFLFRKDFLKKNMFLSKFLCCPLLGSLRYVMQFPTFPSNFQFSSKLIKFEILTGCLHSKSTRSRLIIHLQQNNQLNHLFLVWRILSD